MKKNQSNNQQSQNQTTNTIAKFLREKNESNDHQGIEIEKDQPILSSPSDSVDEFQVTKS